MRHTLLFLALLAAGFASKAQVYSDFEDLTLPTADTYYVNYSMPGTDVGFTDEQMYFPCVYDTSFGFSYWASGYAYSNMTDTSTEGYTNQYAAIPGSGYNSSTNYIVAYGIDNVLKQLDPNPYGNGIQGFYVTNSTYAYLSMKNGDAFAKKFGGLTGNDPDYFRMVIHGYFADTVIADSVIVYLADFRDPDSANDYIVKDWKYVDLGAGPIAWLADSLSIHLESSDTGSFGMNTPAYFCLDHIAVFDREGVHDQNILARKIRLLPVPSASLVNIEMNLPQLKAYEVVNAIGQVYQKGMMPAQNFSIDISQWPVGQYFIRFYGNGQQAVKTIIKE